MIQFIAGFVLLGIVGLIYYYIAKKLDVFGKDHSNDQFGCH